MPRSSAKPSNAKTTGTRITASCIAAAPLSELRLWNFMTARPHELGLLVVFLGALVFLLAVLHRLLLRNSRQERRHDVEQISLLTGRERRYETRRHHHQQLIRRF